MLLLSRSVLCLVLLAPAPSPAKVLRQGPATLVLEGDKLEKNDLAMRYSSTLKVSVTVEGGERLTVQDFKVDLDAKVWTILRQTPGKYARKPDGRSEWRKQLELDPVKPGKLAAPAFSLHYREEPGAESKTVKWPAVDVEVTGPEDADTRDIRGLPPIETLPEKPPWWRPFAYAAVGVLGLALGVLGASFWLRRTRPALVVPPDRWALRELELLEGSEPPAGAGPDWYHTRLSAVVRRYLEERFAFRASRQTTQEFLQDVQQRPELPEAQQQLLRDLLARCDLAKFTGLLPSPAECAEATALTRDLVVQTTPPRR